MNLGDPDAPLRNGACRDALAALGETGTAAVATALALLLLLPTACRSKPKTWAIGWPEAIAWTAAMAAGDHFPSFHAALSLDFAAKMDS